MKQKIQQAYLNKERSKQLTDKQVRRVDELVHSFFKDRSMKQNSKQKFLKRKKPKNEDLEKKHSIKQSKGLKARKF